MMLESTYQHEVREKQTLRAKRHVTAEGPPDGLAFGSVLFSKPGTFVFCFYLKNTSPWGWGWGVILQTVFAQRPTFLK